MEPADLVGLLVVLGRDGLTLLILAGLALMALGLALLALCLVASMGRR